MSRTFFITASTAQRRAILQSGAMSGLLFDVFAKIRERGVLLHEFVIMPEHFHVLATVPDQLTVERVAQLIKGGFSFRAKRELGFAGEVWSPGYHDRRVRTAEESQSIRRYIRQNPVARGLARAVEEYPWSSANPRFKLDALTPEAKASFSSAL
ncbi:MAG TPA: transposase [candidate division Zixibacteria bacterium]|nr:transposase [candidate division Zixibacteria bacterium]